MVVMIAGEEGCNKIFWLFFEETDCLVDSSTKDVNAPFARGYGGQEGTRKERK
jgi:hypothetical protein